MPVKRRSSDQPISPRPAVGAPHSDLAQQAGSLHTRIAGELGRRIVSERYRSGVVLPPEAELLAEFGVSRPLLREAIKSLESKGMLEARQRRGTIVLPRRRWHLLDAEVLGWIAQSGADPDMLIRLTEVRMIVEPGACLLAAETASDAGMRAIEEAWARMQTDTDDPHRFVASDRDFHLALLAAAGNEYLAAIGTAISTALTVSIEHTNPTPEVNRASLASHGRIVAALRKGDGVAAARESRRQLDDALRLLVVGDLDQGAAGRIAIPEALRSPTARRKSVEKRKNSIDAEEE
jgi:GntR family galactonate operon transcriptional repressor